MSEHYTLRCRECNREWGNRPGSICEDCLAPLEVKYDLDAARSTFTRENIARRPANIWRYCGTSADSRRIQAGNSRGHDAAGLRLAAWRADWLAPPLLKNDAVNFPTLSFKDRVVAVALSKAKEFGFETVGCSSTGNLANAVAAQAARQDSKPGSSFPPNWNRKK